MVVPADGMLATGFVRSASIDRGHRLLVHAADAWRVIV